MTFARLEVRIDAILAAVRAKFQPLAVWLLVTYLSFQGLGADPDLFARVAIGRLIEASPSFPLHDPFSFTETKEFWISHEWVSGVVFYALSQLRGDFSLFVFKCLMMFGSIALLHRARKILWGEGPGDFLWLLFAAAGSHYIWSSTVRSQVFTYLFVPLLFWAFANFDRTHRRLGLFAAAAVMPCWAGAHGGFVVGLGFWGFYWLSKLLAKRDELVTVSAAFAVALLGSALSPYGTGRYWEFILDAVFKSRPTITEWAAVSPFSEVGIAPLVLTGCLVWGLLLKLNRTHRCLQSVCTSKWLGAYLYPCLIVGASFFQGWKHERLLALFFMSGVVYGAPLLRLVHELIRERFERLSAASARAGFLLGCVISLLTVATWLAILRSPTSFSLNYDAYPVKAIEWLRSQGGLGGRLLVDFNNGSYAFWRGYPTLQTSLDGRYEEVFPDTTFKRVSEALDVEAPAHTDSLAWVNPTAILLDKNSKSFKERERFGGEWLLVYEDEKFAVLSRQLSENRPVETRHVWEPLF